MGIAGILGHLPDEQQRALRERPLRANVEMLSRVALMALRGSWYRLWLRRAAGLVLIGRQVALRNPEYISVGRFFVAEDCCEIQGLSEGGITFGDHVTIGRFAMIRPSGYYGREIGEGLRVGDYSNIGPYCYIGCSGRIEIGTNVLMSPRVSMYAEDHNFARYDLPIKQQGVTRRSIVVEDDCWLASNSIILAGVRVGKGAIVAAGAVVTRDVPPYSIVAGVPARVIGQRGAGDVPAHGDDEAVGHQL